MTEPNQGRHAIETMFFEERRYPSPEQFARDANAKPDIYDVESERFWREHPLEQVVEWWRQAGITDIHTQRLSVGGAVIIRGTKV